MKIARDLRWAFGFLLLATFMPMPAWAAPEFARQPRIQLVRPGWTARFEAEPSVTQGVSLSWLRNGLPVPGEAGNSITVPNVQLGDDAGYQCVLSDGSGMVTSRVAHLKVLEPPAKRNDVGAVIGWGSNEGNPLNPPAFAEVATEVAPGQRWSSALLQDGRVVFWGDYFTGDWSGPSSTDSIIRIQAGAQHVTGLRSDGTVVSWCSTNGNYGQALVPPGLSGVVDISANFNFSFAVTDSGRVVSWPDWAASAPPADVTNAVQVASGMPGTFALRSDGTVRGWYTIPPTPGFPTNLVPPGIEDVVSLAVGGSVVALRADGTVIEWTCGYGIPNPTAVQVAGISNAVALDPGPGAGNVLLADGTVRQIKAPLTTPAPEDAPGALRNVIRFATTASHGLALTRSPFIVVQPTNAIGIPGSNFVLNAVVRSVGDVRFQWLRDGSPLAGATNQALSFSPVALASAADYRLVADNGIDSVTSRVARVEVYPFNVTAIPLPSYSVRGAAWGDIDSDGDLDLFQFGGNDSWGNPFTPSLDRNEGGGVFSATAFPFTATTTAAEFTDFDNDGVPDLATGGPSGGTVYKNLGSGIFSVVASNLSYQGGGAVLVADFNRDGRTDILFGTQLYLNLGNFTFSNIASPFSNFGSYAFAVGDFNGDELPDIAAMGLVSGLPRTAVYLNKGSGTFQDLQLSLLGLRSGAIRWFDFNGDGRPDLVNAGTDSSGGRGLRVYRNVGGTALSSVTSGIVAVSSASISAADFDGDGLQDLFVNGWNGAEFESRIYQSVGDGTFAQAKGQFSTPQPSFGIWGDADNDGLPDIAAGIPLRGQDLRLALLHNFAEVTPSVPQPPAPVSAVSAPRAVRFMWTADGGGSGGTNRMTYNLRVGRMPAGQDVLSGNSNPEGRRLIAEPGNAGSLTNLVVQDLPFGTYHWAVQSVDAGLVGSRFSEEQLYVFSGYGLPATNLTTSSAQLRAVFDTNELPAGVWFEWGADRSLGFRTEPQIHETNAPHSGLIEANLTNLPPNTVHYFRVVVTNRLGVHSGEILAFKTFGKPELVAYYVTNATTSSATLFAAINPNGSSTALTVEHGADGQWTTLTNAAPLGLGQQPVGFSRLITNLITGREYAFRIIATNSVGIVGPTGLVYVVATRPNAVTLAPSSILAQSAVLAGQVKPNGLDTTAFFEWRSGPFPGLLSASIMVDRTNLQATAAVPIQGLKPGNQYLYRVIASNSLGSSTGSFTFFQTTTRPRLVVASMAESTSDLRVYSLAGSLPFSISISSNLIDWRLIGVMTNFPGGQRFVDSENSGLPVRFYRVDVP